VKWRLQPRGRQDARLPAGPTAARAMDGTGNGCVAEQLNRAVSCQFCDLLKVIAPHWKEPGTLQSDIVFNFHLLVRRVNWSFSTP
jgi:hypothetical protein